MTFEGESPELFNFIGFTEQLASLLRTTGSDN